MALARAAAPSSPSSRGQSRCWRADPRRAAHRRDLRRHIRREEAPRARGGLFRELRSAAARRGHARWRAGGRGRWRAGGRGRWRSAAARGIAGARHPRAGRRRL
ncbi:hypothetical protein E5A74_16935 [Sphingomonas naasensis]|uniref:Uncharacterized protein n=1 Tax=Sphingomonas naasensis TaxID=1344951 RepID=A0A4V6RAZ0_9SPHN|nr:hypothetical protein E5A74_16935 [Sphingomonas naasensis]